jgi:hypothetical protein
MLEIPVVYLQVSRLGLDASTPDAYTHTYTLHTSTHNTHTTHTHKYFHKFGGDLNIEI